jgi:hypothetical protein
MAGAERLIAESVDVAESGAGVRFDAERHGCSLLIE